MNEVWHTCPGCAPRGTRSPAGAVRRMRKRSGSCWAASTRAPGPGPAPARPARPPPLRRVIPSQRARLPCPARRPAGKNAGPRPVKGTGPGRQDLPRGPPRRRHPGPPARRRRTRRAPAGPPRDRRQAQRGQHFTQLLEPLDLDDAVVTFGALDTVRANLAWLVTDKKAHYIAIVKRNQPLLHAQIRPCPGGRYRPASPPASLGTAAPRPGHGGDEHRQVRAVSLAGRPGVERDCGSLAFVGQPACAVRATDARGTRRRWRAAP